MKKRFFYFLFCLALVVPSAIILSACEKEEVYHKHNAWGECVECNEIIHLGQHSLKLEGYDELTEMDIYKCTSCDFILNQQHKHVFNKYKATPIYHWDVCGLCGYEASSNGVHQYGTIDDGWTSNCKFENGVATCKCVDCGYEKTVTLINFEADDNGSVEILNKTNNSYIIKPVANYGFYFEKWLVHKEEYNGKSLNLDELGANDTESVQPIINIEPRVFNDSFWTYSLKPVFTKTEPTFSNIDVVSNVENNHDVEIEYMLYNNTYGTQISYYLPENNKVVLKKITTEHSGDDYNNTSTHYNSTNYDGSLTLPLSSSCGASNALGKCEKVVFEFKDVTKSQYAKVKYDINGKLYDMPGDININKTETFVSDRNGFVTIEKGVERAQEDSSVSFYYVDKWIDEEGNVVSTNKKFKTQINENRIFTAIMKKADEIYEENNVVYLFSNNEDGSLTFEGLYSENNAGEVVIPSLVNEKNVTAIGNNAFMPNNLSNYGRFTSSITVPESVKNFDNTSFNDVGICDITINGNKNNLTFEMFKNSKFAIYSSTYSLATGNSISITSDTLNNMVQKLVKTFANCAINIELVDSSHLEFDALGHYESGTQKLCLLQTGNYSFATLAVIAYELRHFYQDVAIGKVSGLTVEHLNITPTENQIGSWKFLDYADKNEDPDAYWYNAREIDAREFTSNLMGCEIFVK